MEVGYMRRELAEYRKSLFIEGWLDGQFLQLQQLQDESNPDFVFEVVSLFFEDSEKLLKDLTGSIDQHENIVDFKGVDAYVHQFKGSSIGAERVKNACIAFRNFCEDEDIKACLSCLHQVKQEYYLVKNKLQTLFTLEHQILSAAGSVPKVEFSV